jgi:nucleoid DNA-binding protein
MPEAVSVPPALTRRRLAVRMKRLAPAYPAELIQAAIREIIGGLAEALVRERPVILRGFGRFQVRRYRAGAKRLGCIFRPSPALSGRLNAAEK